MGASAGMSTGEPWMHEPVIGWDDRPVCEQSRRWRARQHAPAQLPFAGYAPVRVSAANQPV